FSTALPWNGRPLRYQGIQTVLPVRIGPLTQIELILGYPYLTP
ncbi:uncharacterized protein METZ01_LOCUS77997, partial [marine metagenome]